jgi:hypothetical protein
MYLYNVPIPSSQPLTAFPSPKDAPTHKMHHDFFVRNSRKKNIIYLIPSAHKMQVEFRSHFSGKKVRLMGWGVFWAGKYGKWL